MITLFIKTNFMRKLIYLSIVLAGLFVSGCVKEGPEGLPGLDGRDGLDAEIYYTPWFSLMDIGNNGIDWTDGGNEWYFDVADNAITKDIVDGGIILAYIKVPDDVYLNAVRTLPAYAAGVNWDFLIKDYGTIEFTSNALNKPSRNNCFFRYVLIPGNIAIKKSASVNDEKSLNKNKYNIDELKALPYKEVCHKLGIPE